MKKPIKLPAFKNEDAERDFWDKIDLSDHLEPKDGESVSFPNLKPTTKSISIRLSESLLTRIKEKANAMDVPYQSLIKSSLHQTFFADSD